MKARLFRFVAALTVAASVAGVMTQTVLAEGFYNCVEIWYFTQCFWIDPEDPTGDWLYEWLLWICQSFGGCQ